VGDYTLTFKVFAELHPQTGLLIIPGRATAVGSLTLGGYFNSYTQYALLFWNSGWTPRQPSATLCLQFALRRGNRMYKLSLCGLILVVCATCAFADSNDLPNLPPDDNSPGPLMVGNFGLDGPCTRGNNCNYFIGNQGGDGGRASGSGNFNANISGTAQIAYNFITALPLSWTDTGYSYFSTFGLGGTFQMSLPDGLTFVGVVTSGTSAGEGLTSEVQMNYAGEWSNGQYATGSVYEYDLGNGPHQSLTEMTNQGASQQTPEPSSFLLLGTSVFSAWRWKRQ
jgi:hypothetical protein